ncbi:MAG: hypothetical protein A2550_03345 [Candidatus Jacksonbacteria bacterium RIFOXYD2_FULL_43_21]|nr:MAG: hypothetical protein A2240_00885 [Candidatus Jacksonbacteria bacterium RIFOXYA2_FULL_43_12]OGY78039.1 MAG: hypothetical protein A2550_03345 [Candidatus Jacksonbacteria bacterium RIFOXYD2_FULL_43_21]HCC50172.1 hypothetical protein [Candidatus Jacksonbacteria bacterium]
MYKYLSESPSIDTIRLKVHYPDSFKNTEYFGDIINWRSLGIYDNNKRTCKIWSSIKFREEQKKNKLYKPQYWVEEDFKNPTVKYLWLELSLSKFLHGTNLSAVPENEFVLLIERLGEFLHDIKVILPGQVEGFTVTKMAIAKNIDFTHLCTDENVLKLLAPFNYRPRSKYEYMEASDPQKPKQLKYNTGLTEVICYAKIPEIKKNARTVVEHEIVADCKNKVVGIIRFEVTLKNKRAIRQKMTQLGRKQQSYTLKDVFVGNFWEKVLRDEMGKIFNHPISDYIFLAQHSTPIIQQVIDQNFKTLDVQEKIYYFLGKLQELGLAETKDYYTNHYSRSAWYRRIKKLQKLHIDLNSIPRLASSKKIYAYFLGQFGLKSTKIVNPRQDKLF